MLNDKIALVTGATRGIGRAIALELGRQGATVIGTATGEDGAGKISAFLADAGVTGKGIVLDVTDGARTDAVLGDLAREFGAVTILVNNAGITRDNLAIRMGDDEWDAVIDTNLKAVFRLSRAVMRGMMKARFGRIVNITSVVGYSGNPGQANYCAAKAGRRRHEPLAGPRTGQPQHHRELRRPRFHRHRHDACAWRRAAGSHAGIDSAGACRHARGCRRCRRVPGISRRRLYHGYYRPCEWRDVHGLISGSLGFWYTSNVFSYPTGEGVF